MDNKEIRQRSYRLIKENAAVLFGCAALYGAVAGVVPTLLARLPIPAFLSFAASVGFYILISPLMMAVCYCIPMMLWKGEKPVFRDMFRFCSSMEEWLAAVRYCAPLMLIYNILSRGLSFADKLQKDWLAGIAAGDAAEVVSGSTVDYLKLLDSASALEQNEQLSALSSAITLVLLIARAALFVLDIRVRIGSYYLYAEGLCTDPIEGARRSFDMMRGWVVRYCWLGFSAAWWPMFGIVILASLTAARMGMSIWLSSVVSIAAAAVLPFCNTAAAGLIKGLLYGSKKFKKSKVTKIKVPKY